MLRIEMHTDKGACMADHAVEEVADLLHRIMVRVRDHDLTPGEEMILRDHNGARVGSAVWEPEE